MHRGRDAKRAYRNHFDTSNRLQDLRQPCESHTPDIAYRSPCFLSLIAGYLSVHRLSIPIFYYSLVFVFFVMKLHPNRIFWQDRFYILRPFDEHNIPRVGKYFFESQNAEFFGFFNAIGVDVKYVFKFFMPPSFAKASAGRQSRAAHNDKRGAWRILLRAEAFEKSLDECGFARTQISLERQNQSTHFFASCFLL